MDIGLLKERIAELPVSEQFEIFDMLEQLEILKKREKAANDFLHFVRHVWPNFIESGHHRIMAEAFEAVERGEVKRLIINMAPRHTKSEFASYLFPAWFLGRNPAKKIIQCSNNGELAVGFGRKVRNLVNSEEYKQIFPETALSQDSKAAGRWTTGHAGEYFAVGVSGMVTGRGADLLIIDDPHSEQEAALNSLSIYNNAYEWYKAGPRQRLQPGGAIIMVATRWHKLDLTGQLLKDQVERSGSDQWEVIELPAIVDEHTDNERPIWPSFWPLEELQKTRASLDVPKWQAQYQQRPTSEEGAIVKRDWWKRWELSNPPKCEFVIQAWDTAYSAKQSADFCAATTWGVWRNEENVPCIILLDAFKQRMEFPELKRKVLEEYRKYRPDSLLIEAKAAGTPLIQELRRMGVAVTDVTPTGNQYRSGDKLTRMNAVSDIWASGMVYAPNRRFAEMVIEEMAEFPFGDNDDLVDTAVMAMERFRNGGFISLKIDEDWQQEETFDLGREAKYY